MAASYSSIYNFLTESPGEWNYIKEEPLSPAGSPMDYDSSPQSSQHSVDSQMSTYSPTPCYAHFGIRDYKPDGSLEQLMSLEASSFVKVSPQELFKFEEVMIKEFPNIGTPELFRSSHNSKANSLYSSLECNSKLNIAPFQISSFGSSIPHDVFPVKIEDVKFSTNISHEMKVQFSAHRTPNRHRTLSSDKAPPQRPFKTKLPTKGERKHKKKYGHILWKFLLELLMNPSTYNSVICWTGNKLTFKVLNKDKLASLWSTAKTRQNDVRISYESMTRAIRAYKPKNPRHGDGIITHSLESNFTYHFNESCHKTISDEAKIPFNELLKFIKDNAVDTDL